MKYIPRWFPGAGFKIIAENVAKLSHDVRRLPFVEARDKIVRIVSTKTILIPKFYLLQFSGNSAIRSLTEQEVERCRAGDGRLSETDEFRISATGGVGYMGRLICFKS